MAAVPTAVKNALAVKWATDYPYVGVFTAASTTGDNEASGGGYTRKQAFSSPTATSGVCTGAEVNIPVPEGDYPEGGLFSASSGGDYGGSEPFDGGTVHVSGTGASIDVTPKTKIN
ncbi:hypothetical protein MSP7336_01791 [Mycobacterium shimoidei]|uniref:Uncharacterized protein n=1 Tax=Mycobacterium shimoidei TaxID=29313 RepID=A0A375YXB8_MYCSH|nr:hypothetical protein [Mycobacterium shimoidei]SRX93553.1 hypothetical protein MSP7336_01791 [Mycobacterium shimoidei]